MTSPLTIKDVAAASGFTAATLRYYEQIGVLPAPARSPSGYRLYEPRALERLAFIARAKQLGCTLDEITGLTTAWDGGECGPIQDELRRLVAEKIAGAEDQRAELTTFVTELRRAATALERHRPAGVCDEACGCVSGSDDHAGVVVDNPPTSAASQPRLADERAIACSLSSGSIRDRLADWQALLDHVDHREAIDGGVRCVFAPSVPIGELMRLVAAEQDCCQFLRFAITVDGRGMALEIHAPGEAREIVESMFGAAA
jgi:MerR family transcriptional regulator, copper efflux regulator